jgi:hypothetical protein
MNASFYGTQINVWDVAGFRRNGLGTREDFWHKADVPVALPNVAFVGKADMVIALVDARTTSCASG